MAFIARFPREMDCGQVYDLLCDALWLSDTLAEHDFAASPRLQVVSSRPDRLELDIEYCPGTPPDECNKITTGFQQEVELILQETGEARVRIAGINR